MTLLELQDLSVVFFTQLGSVKAVDGVSIVLEEQETLALVGETGCGKSVVANAILGLLPGNATVRGRVIYRGMDLLKLGERDISRIRGREIAIVFQNPSAALNPVYRILHQVSEPLMVHRKLKKKDSQYEAIGLLQRLGMSDSCLLYPFQLSGGMNQRAMIACSTILKPRILIADEPTKGLDYRMVHVSLDLIRSVIDESRASAIVITHDLDVARAISDRIAVMYCGEIVELGGTKEVLYSPQHPYTIALLESTPECGFKPIPGRTPSMINPPAGCKFHPRCPLRISSCSRERPMLNALSGRAVRCWRCI